MKKENGTERTTTEQGQVQRRRRKSLEEQITDMTRAARYYYEKRKFRANRCPSCSRMLTISDRVRETCPICDFVWPKEDLLRLTQDEVAELIQRPGAPSTRSDVQRLLTQAEEEGIVRVVVTKPQPSFLLEDRAQELESRFKIRARVVQGRDRLFRDLPDEKRRIVRESVLRPAARAAAAEITEILSNLVILQDRATFCVSWGYTMNLVVQELRPRKEMPTVTVVPFVGALTDKPFADIYDGNYLVQKVGEMLLCKENARWLLAPALVDTDQERDVIVGSPKVRDVIEIAREADV